MPYMIGKVPWRKGRELEKLFQRLKRIFKTKLALIVTGTGILLLYLNYEVGIIVAWLQLEKERPMLWELI